MGNGPKHCANLNESIFTIFIDHFEGISERVFLVIFKMFRLFVNTLAHADKYSLLNTGILTQPIYMQLS